MDPWTVTIRVERDVTKLLVTDPMRDVLKARLPMRADHPRALLTLLEGLGLWAGASPLCAAISVADSASRPSVEALFGGDVWPAESALVRFTFVDPPARRRRLSGVGDFRALHRLAVGGAP